MNNGFLAIDTRVFNSSAGGWNGTHRPNVERGRAQGEEAHNKQEQLRGGGNVCMFFLCHISQNNALREMRATNTRIITHRNALRAREREREIVSMLRPCELVSPCLCVCMCFCRSMNPVRCVVALHGVMQLIDPLVLDRLSSGVLCRKCIRYQR